MSKVYAKYVPIVKVNKKKYLVYLCDSIEAPANYTELFTLLRKAESYTSVTLIINNGGGWVDTGFHIIDAIKQTKAIVNAELYGTVASISTVITLACDSIYVSDHIEWLSHNYSAGVQGKGAEIKSQMEFMSVELAKSFRDIHRGFFTESEMDDIIDDKDFWMNKDEILQRWEARKNNDKELLDKVANSRKSKNKRDKHI